MFLSIFLSNNKFFQSPLPIPSSYSSQSNKTTSSSRKNPSISSASFKTLTKSFGNATANQSLTKAFRSQMKMASSNPSLLLAEWMYCHSLAMTTTGACVKSEMGKTPNRVDGSKASDPSSFILVSSGIRSKISPQSQV